MLSNAEAPQVAVASAPANTMLMGEHAVLFGYPALVCALQQRIYVQAARRTDGQLVIESEIGHYQAAITSPAPDQRFEFVLHAIAVSHQETGGLTITIGSDFGHTLGLGSSAAVSVATLAAMALLKQKALEPLTIMHKAIALVRSVQGRGSGADVAASALGGIVEYTANPISANSVTLPDHVWQQAPVMCLVYCGYKTPTPVVITQVALAAAKQPQYFAALYAQMGACVSASMLALAQQDWPQFGAHMNQYQCLMRDLGVSDDAIEKILNLGLQQAPTAGEFAGKISGSGLGDCVLLLGTAGINGWPETQMALNLEPQGVRAEAYLPNHHHSHRQEP
jgi:mevalonate kinase